MVSTLEGFHCVPKLCSYGIASETAFYGMVSFLQMRCMAVHRPSNYASSLSVSMPCDRHMVFPRQDIVM